MNNPTLTNLFKKTILDLKLYDTGNLYRSIQVNVNYINGVVDISVSAADYIKYLLEPYNIISVFINQNGFSKEISNIVKPSIKKIFEDQLKGLKPVIPSYKINISVNA